MKLEEVYSRGNIVDLKRRFCCRYVTIGWMTTWIVIWHHLPLYDRCEECPRELQVGLRDLCLQFAYKREQVWMQRCCKTSTSFFKKHPELRHHTFPGTDMRPAVLHRVHMRTVILNHCWQQIATRCNDISIRLHMNNTFILEWIRVLAELENLRFYCLLFKINIYKNINLHYYLKVWG